MEKGQTTRSIRTRILIIPLICVFVGVLVLGSVSSYFTQKSMKEEMLDNGLSSAQQVVDQIDFNLAAMDALNETLASRIVSIGNIVMNNEASISDSYLSALADATGVSAIYWYNPEGTIVNAAYGEYLGWTAPADHPIQSYIQSGEKQLIEEIRKDSESDNYFKYGYIRSDSGYFVQIGISADAVLALTDQFSYQSMVDKLAASDQVSFASYINSEFIVEADSNEENIGTSFAEVVPMQLAVNNGEITTEEIVDNGENIFLIVYPVEINGERIGALNLGYSMAAVDAAISSNITTTVIAGLIIFALLAFILVNASNSIIKPVNSIKEMIKEFRQGRLSTRLNISRDDEIGEMATTLDGFADDLQFVIMGALKKLADGDVSVDMEVRDEMDEIGPVINNTIYSVRALVNETNMISQAVKDGELDVTADADAFKGGFKDVIDGVNETTNTIKSLIEIVSYYIGAIGRGEIPDKITEAYTGAFEVLKGQINDCVTGLGALEEGNRVLNLIGGNNDLSQTIENEYQGIYGEIATAVNQVHATLAGIERVSQHISQGDLSDLNMMKQMGSRSDKDTLTPSLIAMIENINTLVEETRTMAQKAVEGELQYRGDETKIPGEYGHIISGFNQTLDAVISPIQEAQTVLGELAQGNLQVEVEGQYQGDHTMIKDGINQTVESLRRYVSEITLSLEKMAQGDLDQEITSRYDGDFLAIKNSLNQISVELSKTMRDINVAADEVGSGAKQIADGSQALAQGTTEQASSIQELTASIESIASETKRNAVNANNANDRAVNVRKNAQVGNDQMENMTSAMEAIKVSSNDISKIIKVIDDIAFQTNILALNAAVEAARAGQHGKGFAVVAEEVRTLAARSAEAAKETTILIEGSIEKVAVGTGIADETAESLREILSEIGEVTDLVSNIAQASNDQATEIAQVSVGIEQVSNVVQVNSATAEESAASSEELSSQAELLKSMINKFKIKR
ncbi:methyl-accepting chemotaxis protein [Eubacteriaceae bacterium ES3]|nr:methyl-accepting chemotaxis protein [Eubacteriaceae bacterium ES3]